MENLIEKIFNNLGKIITTFVSLFLFYLLFLNHIDINEVGVAYNSRTGEIKKQETGWHFTAPWVKTSALPIIPIRVEVYNGTTRPNRFILPKLVVFQPNHLEEFIKTEGFRWYGAGSIENMFAQYAFSGKDWSFLKEIKQTP